MNEAQLEKELRLYKWDRICSILGVKLQIESHQYRLKGHNQIIDILAYTSTQPKIYYIFELKIDGVNAKDMGQIENYALLLKAEKQLYDHQIKIVMIGKDKNIDTKFIAKWNHIPFDKHYISYKHILSGENDMPNQSRKNFSIAVTNTRGGVGKSTTAFILACLLQQKGHKVLAIDLDPQGTLTYYALNGQDNTKIKQGISTILLEDTTDPASLVKNTDKGFDLIPANDSLKDDQHRLTSIPGKETLLQELVLSKTKFFNYDVVIVDVPGAIGTLFQIATISTDKALIVFEPDNTNENPIRNTLHYIRKSKNRINKNLRNEDLFLGGLPSKYDKQLTTVHKVGLEYLSEKVFSTIPIKVYSYVSDKAPFKKIITTFDLSPFKQEKELLEPYYEIIKDIEKHI